MLSGINKLFPEIDYHLLKVLLWILLFVGLINSLQYFYFLLDVERSFNNFFTITLSKVFYFVYYFPLAIFLYYLNTKLKFAAKPIQYGIIHLGLMLLSFVLHQSLTYQLDKLLLSEKYSLSYLQALLDNPQAWIDIVAYLLLLSFIILLDIRKTWAKSNLKSAELEQILTKTKLNELRNRIHPVFLFNTLSSIRTFINKGDSKEANNTLIMLCEFLRTTVYESDKEEAKFDDEIKFLELYFKIEKKSLTNLSYKINVADKEKNITIPYALLQPIAESVIYRVGGANSGNLYITLTANLLGESLHIEMLIRQEGDTIINVESILENESLELIKERLSQLTEGQNSISVSLDESNNLVIRILLYVKKD